MALLVLRMHRETNTEVCFSAELFRDKNSKYINKTGMSKVGAVSKAQKAQI